MPTATQLICVHCSYPASEVSAYGKPVCQQCLRAHYARCCACGGYWRRRELTRVDGEQYCDACRPSLMTFETGQFEHNGQCMEVGSCRSYGIELETHTCPGHGVLVDSVWGAKHDCSIKGLEFVSPILAGDAGLTAVHELAGLALKNGWQIEDSCGYHLHLNLRGNTREEQFAIAYAFRAPEDVWFSFVEAHRADQCGYSFPCDWKLTELNSAFREGVDYPEWGDLQDRYNWLNLSAYYPHSTIEIRSHEGTCDGEAVCNWVKACIRFADWADWAGYEQVKGIFAECKTARERFEVIAAVWKDDTLAAYYAAKARRLHGVIY